MANLAQLAYHASAFQRGNRSHHFLNRVPQQQIDVGRVRDVAAVWAALSQVLNNLFLGSAKSHGVPSNNSMQPNLLRKSADFRR